MIQLRYDVKVIDRVVWVVVYGDGPNTTVLPYYGKDARSRAQEHADEMNAKQPWYRQQQEAAGRLELAQAKALVSTYRQHQGLLVSALMNTARMTGKSESRPCWCHLQPLQPTVSRHSVINHSSYCTRAFRALKHVGSCP